MSTVEGLGELASILNEITERIGITFLDIAEAYENDETAMEVEPIGITTEERYSYKFFEQKEKEALEATQRQVDKVFDFKYQDRQTDSEERALRSNGYRSEYTIDCIINSWNGDLPVDRYWFKSSKYSIDATVTTPLYVPREERIDYSSSSWYKKKSKSKYRSVTVHLSRHIKERQYGRVFFGTETRYVPLGQTPLHPIRRTHQVKGYIKIGNDKIFCKPEVYKNPLKGLLYKDKGSSILKETTVYGKRIETIFWNLQLCRNNPDYFPGENGRNEGSVARNFFRTLKNKYNYQIQDWATETLGKDTLDRETTEWEKHLQVTRYAFSSDYLEEEIERLQEGNKLFNKYCSIIQYNWKRKFYYKRHRKAIIIGRAYRAYVIRAWASGEFAPH